MGWDLSCDNTFISSLPIMFMSLQLQHCLKTDVEEVCLLPAHLPLCPRLGNHQKIVLWKQPFPSQM